MHEQEPQKKTPNWLRIMAAVQGLLAVAAITVSLLAARVKHVYVERDQLQSRLNDTTKQLNQIQAMLNEVQTQRDKANGELATMKKHPEEGHRWVERITDPSSASSFRQKRKRLEEGKEANKTIQNVQLPVWRNKHFTDQAEASRKEPRFSGFIERPTKHIQDAERLRKQVEENAKLAKEEEQLRQNERNNPEEGEQQVVQTGQTEREAEQARQTAHERAEEHDYQQAMQPQWALPSEDSKSSGEYCTLAANPPMSCPLFKPSPIGTSCYCSTGQGKVYSGVVTR